MVIGWPTCRTGAVGKGVHAVVVRLSTSQFVLASCSCLLVCRCLEFDRLNTPAFLPA